LIYLDTSTFGALARGADETEPLADALRTALDSETGVCVGAPWHDDEAALLRFGSKLDRLVQTIRTYTLDVRMKFDEELINYELYAAAYAFTGEPYEMTWREAFRKDPDNPPLKPFQADYLNRKHAIEHPPAPVDEVQHDRGTSESLTEAHTYLRAEGVPWEEVAAANLDEQVRYLLGPLAGPGFLSLAEKRERAAIEDWLRGGPVMEPGSPTGKYLRVAHIASNARRMRERFPAIDADPQAFCASEAVRSLPMIRLFAFLLAALSVDGRRTRPQQSDLHDLWHLTYGLSRCDVVTADRRSCEITRGRNLVPQGVRLIEAHRFDEVAKAVAESCAGR
jgi:hypothetical protein